MQNNEPLRNWAIIEGKSDFCYKEIEKYFTKGWNVYIISHQMQVIGGEAFNSFVVSLEQRPNLDQYELD